MPPAATPQGRARPSLAKLYNWRYRSLGDLPAVSSDPAFQRANAGLALDFQLIDVPDFNGRGESEPVAYFYQVRVVSEGSWGARAGAKGGRRGRGLASACVKVARNAVVDQIAISPLSCLPAPP